MKIMKQTFMCMAIATILVAQEAYAQVDLLNATAAFYWDVNNAHAKGAIDVQDGMLGLKYFDHHGKQSDITLKIFNWKREEVINLVLDKTPGLNYYTIELDQYYSAWEENVMYTCQMVDEGRTQYEWTMKLVPPARVDAPVLDILVNPLTINCEDMKESHVEFYGKIEGGKSPYLVNWYVINDHQTGFLFQPREEKLQKAGKTTVIMVDSQPDYYVLLHVKDGCGNIEKKMVHLICENKKKQINTVFIEPIRTLDNLTPPTN